MLVVDCIAVGLLKTKKHAAPAQQAKQARAGRVAGRGQQGAAGDSSRKAPVGTA
jgi:hypothetical protein